MKSKKEYLKKLKEIQRKSGDQPLTQEEADMLRDWIDEIHGIERQPSLGCFIVILGSILFWCGIYWLWVSLY